jgi:hypothetical protein
MISKFGFGAIFAMSVLPCVAYGQQSVDRQGAAADKTPPQAQIVRIETSMNLSLPIAVNTGIEDQIKSIESTKEFLYQEVARGCNNLKNVFKGSCALKNVRIGSSMQNRCNSGESASINVGASYEVTYTPK